MGLKRQIGDYVPNKCDLNFEDKLLKIGRVIKSWILPYTQIKLLNKYNNNDMQKKKYKIEIVLWLILLTITIIIIVK